MIQADDFGSAAELTPAPPLEGGCALCVLLVGEIVLAKGFRLRRLYVEYRIVYDPALWRLLPPPGGGQHRDSTAPRPGLVRVRVLARMPTSWRRLWRRLLF